MQTGHWTWTGDELLPHGGGELIPIGKKNLLNNFCVGVESASAAWPDPRHLPEREYTSRVKSLGAVTLAGGGYG